MLKVPVVKGNINRALKNFKKKFRDTKTLQKLRDRKEYTKPSIAKRQAKEGIKKESKVNIAPDITKPITLDDLTNPNKK